MASITSMLDRLKQDLEAFLNEPMILEVCAKAGHHWRQRQLGPVQTIHLFILHALNFNTAMTALRHMAKEPIQASAYCLAYMSLPLATVEALPVQSPAVMLQAAQRENATPNRIDFLDTLRWLLIVAPDEPLPDLLANPLRSGHHEPGVIKDLQDAYQTMARLRKKYAKS